MSSIATAATEVVVIGIGNVLCGDDGAGPAVAERLARCYAGDPQMRVVDLDGEATRLVEAWRGAASVWVVDAVRSGREPGTVRKIAIGELAGLDDTAARLGGGHLWGLGAAVELATAIGAMPAELRVLGIEGSSFELGTGLTDPVRRAVDHTVALLTYEMCLAHLVRHTGTRERARENCITPSASGARASASRSGDSRCGFVHGARSPCLGSIGNMRAM
jgi:hydrogenase maturation protease